jgi:uncharacterized membrane protein
LSTGKTSGQTRWRVPISEHLTESLPDEVGSPATIFSTRLHALIWEADDLMNIWYLLSIVTVAALVGMFSGPLEALTRSMRRCRFEVFVETVDRMSHSVTPTVTVLLPSAFLALSVVSAISCRQSPKLFSLNATALALFVTSLLVTILFEIPLVEEIVTWAALALPGDWRRTRDRWIRYHRLRVALGFMSLVLLFIAGCIQEFAVPSP